MTKVVYIAHCMMPDIKENTEHVLSIMRDIHTSGEDVIPFAPYLLAFMYLDDKKPEERRLGMDANKFYFENKIINEMRIYGPRISSGIQEEIHLCFRYNIPVVCKNTALQSELENILSQCKPKTLALDL